MAATSGSPKARALGAWMRDARTKADLTVRQLARQLGTTHVELVRWENAERMPAPEHVQKYLVAVGVGGPELDRLVDLARSAAEPNWVAVGEAATSEALAALLHFEETAQEIFAWQPGVVPGMGQTGDYTRAIMRDGKVEPNSISAHVAVRLSRRDVLKRRNPVRFHAVIGHEALVNEIGGTEVFADQLRALAEFAQLPTVTLQVLPRPNRWHPGIPGGFELLEFDSTSGGSARPIVHLEHLKTNLFLFDGPQELAGYRDAAATLREMAMSADESLAYIADRITKLERGNDNSGQ